MTSRQPLLPNRGRGKRLSDLLRKELGVPEGCREFSVRFAFGEIVTVNCVYCPSEAVETPPPARDPAEPGAVEEVTTLADAVSRWARTD